MTGKFTIVGIDPGTTVAIATLDMGGNVVDIFSSKDISVNHIIKRILSLGYPAIIATDVNPAPQTVEKVAASFDSKLFVPKTSISLKEKNEIGKKSFVQNAHERDALSAAIKAFQFHCNKFENVDSRLRELDKEELSEEVKSLVLKDYTVSNAVECLTHEREIELPIFTSDEKAQTVPGELQHKIKLLSARIINQKAYIVELEKRIMSYRAHISNLELQLNEWDESASIQAKSAEEVDHKDSIIRKQQSEIFFLKSENKKLCNSVEELKRLRFLQLREEIVVCKVLEQFTKSKISGLDALYGIRKGDILYVKDGSGGGRSTARFLCEKGIKAIIAGTEMSHPAIDEFQLHGVAFFKNNDIEVTLLEDYGILDREEFETAYSNWLKRNSEIQKTKKRTWLKGLIEEYKHERKKDI
ncbi:MAG: DUF460 domain-containing protein [Candidatus Methanofastidiosia archaeon]